MQEGILSNHRLTLSVSPRCRVMLPDVFIAHIDTCFMVMSLHTLAQSLELRMMEKLPDEDNSCNSSCVILF